MEIPLVSQQPITTETGKPGEQKIPLYRYAPAASANSETEEKLSNVKFGMGAVYSIASLKAAAEYQNKLASVAENNILATGSVARIPDILLQQFRA